jgi:hypothetical protein
MPRRFRPTGVGRRPTIIDVQIPDLYLCQVTQTMVTACGNFRPIVSRS